MAIRSSNPNVDPVRSILELLLRGFRTPADVTKPLKDLYMKSHLAAFCATSLWLNSAPTAPQGVRRAVPDEEKIEKEPEMSTE